MKDQYLRRGFRLKSVSTTSRPLPRMPGSRPRTLTTASLRQLAFELNDTSHPMTNRPNHDC
ncbi:hypothetical protein EFP14_15560 [Lactiplantibacillus pentosus]|nr:hypothetical protein [Lactiplantibacillus pentosus]